jgi:dTMP kinase
MVKMLIVYEGIDGSGKSTSSRKVCEALEASGKPTTIVQWTSFAVRPEEENALFRTADRHRRDTTLGPLSYSLWHCADFAYRLEQQVLPALQAGKIVIMDRYKYTAYVRDVIRGLDEQTVRSFYSFAPEPDLVIYLDVDPAVTYKRKKMRNLPFGFYECGMDIFGELDQEAAFLAFQSLCRRRYQTVLPKTTIRIDGTRKKSEVNGEILKAVHKQLPA